MQKYQLAMQFFRSYQRQLLRQIMIPTGTCHCEIVWNGPHRDILHTVFGCPVNIPKIVLKGHWGGTSLGYFMLSRNHQIDQFIIAPPSSTTTFLPPQDCNFHPSKVFEPSPFPSPRSILSSVFSSAHFAQKEKKKMLKPG